jgi:hypothetical protein
LGGIDIKRRMQPAAVVAVAVSRNKSDGVYFADGGVSVSHSDNVSVTLGTSRWNTYQSITSNIG